MAVGLALKLAGNPRAASVTVQFGGLGEHPLPTGFGNRSPAEVWYGNTVRSLSLW